MRVQSHCETCDMLTCFGRYCRIRPLVFSLVPRFQEWCGVAKQIRVRVMR
jgi:hypothetical protein